MPTRDLSLGILFTAKMDETFGRIAGQVNTALGQVNNSMNKMTQATEQSRRGFITYDWSIKNIIADMEKLLAVQARWYGAKFLLFAGWEAPFSVLKEGIKHLADIDEARAKIERYAAMEGTLGTASRKAADDVIFLARQITTHLPIAFDEVIKSADRLIAAGVGVETVKATLESFSKLHIAFPEINMEKFSTAIIGFLNATRNTKGMKELGSDTERLNAILDKTTLVLSKSVLAPENITLVVQYLGQIGTAVGFSVDQLLSMAGVLTNLGSKAGPAARALRGLFISLSTEGAQKQLKSLGIEIDRTQTIASQFEKIITGLQKALGESKLSIGGLQALMKVAPTERMGPLLSFMKDFDEYNKLVKASEGSTGALDRAAGRMSETLKSQWTVLKNVLKEFGSMFTSSEELGNSLNILSGILKGVAWWFNGFATFLRLAWVQVVTLAENIILLVDSIWKFGDVLWKLMKFDFSGAKKSFKDWWGYTSEGFKGIGKQYLETMDKIMLDADKRQKIIFGALPKTKGGAIKAGKVEEEEGDLKTPSGAEAKEKYKAYLSDIRSAEKASASARMSEIRSNYALEDKMLENSYKAKMISEEDYQNQKKELRSRTTQLLQQELDEELKDLEKSYNESYAALSKIKDPTERNRRLKVLQAREEADYAKIDAKQNEINNKIKLDADEDFYRQHADMVQRDTNLLIAQAEIEKRNIDTILSLRIKGIEEEKRINQFKFERGEITSTQFYEKEIELVNELTEAKREAYRKDRNAFLIENAAKVLAAGENEKDLEKLGQEREINLQELLNKLALLEKDSANDILEINRKLSTDLEAIYGTRGGWLKAAKEGLKEWLKEAKKTGRQIADLAKGVADAMTSSLSDLFVSMGKGEFNINKESDIKNTEGTLRQIGLEKESLELKKQQIEQNKQLSESEKEKQLAAIDAQMAQLEANEQIVKSQQEALKNQTSLLDVFRKFLEELLNMMAKFLAEKVVMNFLQAIGNINWGSTTGAAQPGAVDLTGPVEHGGGLYGESNVYRRMSGAGLLSVQHGGVGSDEILAVRRKNESVFTPGQMRALGDRSVNVAINVENKSSQPVNAKQSKTQFDGKKYIINVILEDINQGGVLRGVMG